MHRYKIVINLAMDVVNDCIDYFSELQTRKLRDCRGLVDLDNISRRGSGSEGSLVSTTIVECSVVGCSTKLREC